MLRSLIERLSSDPGEDARRPTTYGSVYELRNAVSRDLEELLNTRSEMLRWLPESMPECRASSLTYGIPDFSSYSLLGSQDRDRIKRSLERTIIQHEPRLTRVRVSLDPPVEHERALRFRVDAMLSLGPEREKVSFDAVLQLATQIYAVQ